MLRYNNKLTAPKITRKGKKAMDRPVVKFVILALLVAAICWQQMRIDEVEDQIAALAEAPGQAGVDDELASLKSEVSALCLYSGWSGLERTAQGWACTGGEEQPLLLTKGAISPW